MVKTRNITEIRYSCRRYGYFDTNVSDISNNTDRPLVIYNKV